MTEQAGYIKLHRTLLDDPIWLNQTPELKTVLITVLLRANFKPNTWERSGEKFSVEAGQFITSLRKLSDYCGKGISVQNVRTALKKFEKFKFLIKDSTYENTRITICNWNKYQNITETNNNTTGYIKLHRALLDDPVWLNQTPELKTVLITVLLRANFKPNTWERSGEKFSVEAGQFITSLQKLSDYCGKGISVQNVRTALKKFEKFKFLTKDSTNENTRITICNWDKYQNITETNNNTTNLHQTLPHHSSNTPLTTNNKEKNYKNEKNSLYSKNSLKNSSLDFENIYLSFYNKPEAENITDEQLDKRFYRISEHFEKEQSWRESICMKIGKPEQFIWNYQVRFIEQLLTNKSHILKSIHDLKHYFINWLNKKIKQ